MPLPARDEFSRRAIEIIRARFPLAKVGRAEETFSLRINGRVASLEHLYRTVQLAPDDMQHHIERWAVEILRDDEGAPDRQGDFDDVRDKVLPLVISDQTASEKGRQIIVNPLIEGLSVTYVMDGDRTIAYLPPEILKEWEIEIDQLHEVALENLITKSQAIPAHAAQDDEGQVTLVLFQTLDGYDAARILLPSLHSRLVNMLGSPFAVAVPNRDILLCFRQDEETIERIRQQVADDYRTMPHALSDKLFLCTPDGIAPLK